MILGFQTRATSENKEAHQSEAKGSIFPARGCGPYGPSTFINMDAAGKLATPKEFTEWLPSAVAPTRA